MSLDPAYLDYPHRRHGMDHDIYPWSNLFERPALQWPGDRGVAAWIVVDLEYFSIQPSDSPFRAPGHMQTPYPDYRHYSAREYGTRIGFYRLLDSFAKAGVHVSVAVNAAIAERYPEIVRDIVSAGHEIIAHSTDMNGTIATGLDEAAERQLIARSLDTLEAAAGTRPRGWRSIARSQSVNTLRLLAEAGVDYQCDWVNDDLPYRMATPAGAIANLPLNHELSDRQVILVQQQSMDSYVEQIGDAAAWLSAEAERFGGRILPLNFTPYIVGLPYRMDLFDAMVASLAGQSDVWVARGDAILDAWSVQQPG
jgi:allantoinase